VFFYRSGTDCSVMRYLTQNIEIMKRDIKQIVEETFEKFPTAQQVFATSDGNVFLEENRAMLHAGKDGKYSTYTKDIEDTVDTSDVKLRGSKELIAEIKAVEQLEDLQKYITGETRKTVLDAVEKRTTELTTVKDDSTGAGSDVKTDAAKTTTTANTQQ